MSKATRTSRANGPPSDQDSVAPPLSSAITSAAELWSAIVDRGGLDIQRYDEPIVAELAAQLNLPTVKAFEKALGEGAISVEQLLASLLRAIAPYSQMLSETLAFFSRAGARSSDQNLVIEFDFAEARESLALDLEQFMAWALRVEAATQLIDVPALSPFAAAHLRQVFVRAGITYHVERGRSLQISPREDIVNRWLNQATASKECYLPRRQPPAASTKNCSSGYGRRCGQPPSQRH